MAQHQSNRHKHGVIVLLEQADAVASIMKVQQPGLQSQLVATQEVANLSAGHMLLDSHQMVKWVDQMTIAMGHMSNQCQPHLVHIEWDGVHAVGLVSLVIMAAGWHHRAEWKYMQPLMIQPITVQYLPIHHFGELCPDVMVKRLI